MLRLSKTQGSYKRPTSYSVKAHSVAVHILNVFPPSFLQHVSKRKLHWQNFLAYLNVHKMPSLALNLCNTEHILKNTCKVKEARKK